MRIENLLEHSDSDLLEIFNGSTTCENGADIRTYLEAKKAYGDVFIGSDNCEGFNPITGCPGHEPKSVMPLKARIIIRELEFRKNDMNFYTPRSMGAKAAYQDAINLINEMYKEELEVSNG